VLGVVTSIAFTVWGLKNGEEQVQPALLNLLIPEKIQENTTGATIMFQRGQKGRLSRNHKDYQYFFTLTQRSLERQQPVGARIDSAGEIAEIARADNDFVAFLAEGRKGSLRVGFQMHDGISYLERQHPRFDKIAGDLNRSLKEKKRIWFVWRLPKLTLEDVLIVEEDIKASSSGQD
jgi:hypothetical protein